MANAIAVLLTAFGLLYSAGSVAAADGPSLARLQRLLGSQAIPAGLGVNVPAQVGRSEDLRKIADFGFRLVRTDLLWANIERAPGVFDWRRYDAFVSAARRVGLTPMLILDYSNPLYAARTNPTVTAASHAFAPPVGNQARAAFTRFAGAAAARFGPDVIWEIWNEPDLNFGSPFDLNAYVDFAMEACQAVRAASPEAPVIGPAASGFVLPLLRRFLTADATQCFDAVSLHPYRDRAPDDVLLDWPKLHAVTCAQPGACRALISSEWGYSSWTTSWTATRQADYVPRLYLLDLLAGVPVTIIYDWQDDANLPGDKEANFGLVDHFDHPKPVYYALRTLLDGLRGLTLLGRVANLEDGAMVLAFGRDGHAAALVGWSDAGGEVTIPTSVCLTRPGESAGCGREPQFISTSAAMRLSSRPSLVKLSQ